MAPACSITPATEQDIEEVQASANVEDGALAIHFYGELVAVTNEYGTVFVRPDARDHIEAEKLEKLIEVALDVMPEPYDETDPVCFRCGYRQSNHWKRVPNPQPLYTGSCEAFVETPVHLRFQP